MEDWSKYDKKFRYMMLSRMKQDCDYYLRIKAGSPYILWAGSAKAQIENMKAIWNTFSPEDKPEWLTWDDLKEYAIKMEVDLV